METHPPPYHACIFYLTPSESWNNLDYIPLPFFKKSGWMPVWLMPFELYRLTIVTFRQCTKFCFFSKHKLSNSTWWLLVPPDVIFQMIKCITVFSGACNAPGSCFSLLLTQWTACLSCFMFFRMSSGLSVNFIIPALWLLQYFVLAFFFFKCRAYLFCPPLLQEHG